MHSNATVLMDFLVLSVKVRTKLLKIKHIIEPLLRPTSLQRPLCLSGRMVYTFTLMIRSKSKRKQPISEQRVQDNHEQCFNSAKMLNEDNFFVEDNNFIGVGLALNACLCFNYHSSTCILIYFAEPNPCHPNPCKNGGACTRSDSEEKFSCICQEGFKGEHCDCKCQDMIVFKI